MESSKLIDYFTEICVEDATVCGNSLHKDFVLDHGFKKATHCVKGS